MSTHNSEDQWLAAKAMKNKHGLSSLCGSPQTCFSEGDHDIQLLDFIYLVNEFSTTFLFFCTPSFQSQIRCQAHPQGNRPFPYRMNGFATAYNVLSTRNYTGKRTLLLQILTAVRCFHSQKQKALAHVENPDHAYSPMCRIRDSEETQSLGRDGTIYNDGHP